MKRSERKSIPCRQIRSETSRLLGCTLKLKLTTNVFLPGGPQVEIFRHLYKSGKEVVQVLGDTRFTHKNLLTLYHSIYKINLVYISWGTSPNVPFIVPSVRTQLSTSFL